MATGEVIIDFGTTPTSEGSVAVTGQSAILTTSLAEAFVQGASTPDNDEASHIQLGKLANVVCSIPTLGDGFTINVEILHMLVTGQFKLKWVWT